MKVKIVCFDGKRNYEKRCMSLIIGKRVLKTNINYWMHVNPLQTTSDNDFIGELSRVCLRQLIMNKVCLSSKDFEECINN